MTHQADKLLLNLLGNYCRNKSEGIFMSMTVAGANGASGSSQVWSGASMRKPMDQKMSDLFSQIDSTGSGSITKSQFEQAFQSTSAPSAFKSAGADAVWAKLDPSSSGTVTKQQFTDGMQAARSQIRGGRHHHQSSSAAQTPPSKTVGQSLDALSAVGTNISTKAYLDNSFTWGQLHRTMILSQDFYAEIENPLRI
jgi:hypothetical protein